MTRLEPANPEPNSPQSEGDFRQEIGLRLKLTRYALHAIGRGPKWQKDFATSIGLPNTTYCQIESGTQLLMPDQAVRIRDRYGVSLNWLYAGSKDDLPLTLATAIEALWVERSR